MPLKENLLSIKNTFINPNCLLIAVSKTHPASSIREIYDLGHRDFGENKVQELTDKAAQLPQDIRWHMIGHLQRNKVKYIAPFVFLIHGVDSLKLLQEIDKQAEKNNRIISCLLQVHIAEEESKFGFSEEELMDLIHSEELKALNNIKIIGLMGMATYTENVAKVRKEFAGLKSLFEKLKALDLSGNVDMKELSMGMSGDYLIAQEEGSTMVRIGSAIFGERNYN
ncbi:YggS family pyridoxal phosphate-dependent enzyme [Cecembia rubra]|uniref:YggS family pyridoxal phosphate-dependent enzyme n=1 Tax=Cecembia rubra TaxID=1485585 RepID=UPI0027145C38|nr:YggS family pyridoxal phosphate-dependent enzyme [Cecembia rubra]